MRFVVTGLLHIGVYTVVEARTRAQAIKLAETRGLPHLCAQCTAKRHKDEYWHWCFGEEIRGDVDEIALYANDAKTGEERR